ncbi:substrate-binding periplasmic protein [Curvivirga aplysinae]|uniref:substrate-binding periplasmic protein n=1 Tax=Curvivirga aplysinae TaxID=2529852 RepID=UPI0012BD5530|nr:transporter substrate-binding domain-containing protein [Curvivirga aplysinae]MTI08929.1 transporter substrate-binding domain-containing protein [Curvivirga aplysinae]
MNKAILNLISPLAYLAFLIISFTKLTTPAIAESLIFTTTNFPPFSIEGKQNEEKPGFIVELVTEAFHRHGHKVEFRFLPTERAQRLARSGNVTGSFRSTKPKKDKEIFIYSKPFSNLSASFFTLDNYIGPELFDLEDARDIRLAAPLGTPLETILTKLNIPHTTVRSEEFGLRLLLGQRVDAFLSYTLSTEWIYQRLQTDTALREMYAEEIALYPFYLAIHKNQENAHDLMNQFDKSISIMKRDGSYHNILISYVNYLKP